MDVHHRTYSDHTTIYAGTKAVALACRFKTTGCMPAYWSVSLTLGGERKYFISGSIASAKEAVAYHLNQRVEA